MATPSRIAAITAIVLACLSILVPGAPVGAEDDDDDDSLLRLLHGAYHASQMNVCVTTRAGEVPPTFDETTLALVGPAESIAFQSQGVTRFDGRGGVRVRGVAMALFLDRVDPGELPVGLPTEFTCSGTYSVSPGRLFAIDVGCTGPLFDVAPIRLRGAIGPDRKTLIFADTEPTIERLLVDGNVIGERVCIAIATDVRAKKDD